jgi:pimeloyl-ACP methyl ester carboxylesterase
MKRAQLAADERVPRLEQLAPPWPGRRVTLDGASVHVRDTPATRPGAPPAVYVHGLGGSSQNWTDLAGLLTDHLDGQAVDLPGFGRSDPHHSYTVPALAGWLARWIEHSGRAPVHLVGNSLGGTITVKLAATRPDLVRTLTLVSPALPFLDPRRTLQGQLLPLLALPRARRIAARMLAGIEPEELTRRVIEAIVADPRRIPDQRLTEAIDETRRRYLADHYVDTYLRTMRGLVTSFLRAYLPGEGSLWQVAAGVPVPTLVITGRQDRMVDIRVAPQTAKLIPDSRLLVLDGVGHVAQMEVPRTVARAMVSLLEEADGHPMAPAPVRRWRLPRPVVSTPAGQGAGPIPVGPQTVRDVPQ